MNKTKKIKAVISKPAGHWVGDGFPVSTLFSYNDRGGDFSPFLLLDYAGPAEFPASDKPKGVGEHPHRGFETVTIVYQGEVEHRDSGGGGGKIGPGDVQWMTAASGVVHEEMHSKAFTKHGGTMEMVQLWVNLPAKSKMSAPRYQELVSSQFPVVPLANDSGTARIIAGSFQNTKGPARTFTPVHLWDLRLKKDRQFILDLPDQFTSLIFVLKGKIVAGGTTIGPVELGLLDREGGHISIEAREETTALVLSGEPIQEPIAGYGPFVMNTQDEIRQAMDDYQNGRMGRLAQRTG